MSAFDLSLTEFIDDSAAVIITDLVTIAMSRQTRTIVIAGMKQTISDTMHSMGLLEGVPRGNCASDVDEAKRIIRRMLRSETSPQAGSRSRF